ncbi:MAG: response regulator [Nitrospirae bacterium]|nr:response regulator [Nitrospirota bacterium]
MDKLPELGMDATHAQGLRRSPFGPVVLIVDDDDQIRSLLRRLLSGRCRCIEAADGTEGYALALRETPDIILTDHEMPGLKGADLCRTIRGSPALAGTKIILMSGTFSGEGASPEKASGCDAFLKKPFDPQELYETLGLGA